MRNKLVLLFLVCVNLSYGQLGGNSSYQFLRLSPSARVTALGGATVPVRDGDLAMAYHQPASLSEETHQAIVFSQSFYPGDINFGMVSYGHSIKDSKFHLQAGVQYINYGEFQGFDPTGTAQGQFTAGEQAFFVGASREISDRLAVGLNLKIISSSLESYTSLAAASDLSMIYLDDERDIGLSLLVRNAGAQLTLYDEVHEKMPLDIQVAFTKRLKYLPFRFGVVLHSLNQLDLSYPDPRLDETVSLEGNNEENLNIIQNASRHLILNGEFLLGPNENFNIRFSYRNQRRAELEVAAFRTLSGFSGGVGFRVSKFKFDYGFANYHLAGTEHHLTLSTNIQRFTKDREM